MSCTLTAGITYNRIYRTEATTSSSPIILHFPRGLPHSRPSDLWSHDDTIPAALASNVTATVVTVNYRFNTDTPHPIAIHDTLAAYDWVRENLMPRTQSTTNNHGLPEYGGIKVYGELIGGGLAAMLALTECHVSKSQPRISVAALVNPVLDWTFSPSSNFPFDGSTVMGKRPSSKPSKSKQASWDKFSENADDGWMMADLLALRDSHFRTPEAWFDPFASPLLFFRTAGIAVPSIEMKIHGPSHSTNPSQSRDSIGQNEHDLNPINVSTRRVHLHYPSNDSGLRLPFIHIESSAQNPLRDQSIELAALIHRSIVLRKIRGRELTMGTYDDDRLLDAKPRISLWKQEETGSLNDKMSHKMEELRRVIDWMRNHST